MNTINVINATKQGVHLLTQPGLRKFVLIPLIINILVFATLSWYAISQFTVLLDWATNGTAAILPDWASGAAGFLIGTIKLVLSIIFAIFMVLTVGYTFTIVANIIAAPFNSFLAEKIEIELSGSCAESEPIASMVLRTIGRELQKLLYFLPRSIGVFFISICLGFIPLINLIVPIITFAWTSWVLAVQYMDYPIDNHQVPFKKMLIMLSQERWLCLCFGGLMFCGTVIPGISLFVMPIAVATASVIWCDSFKQQWLLNKN